MIIQTTEAHFHYIDSEDGGWCVACGEEAFGVEPDAAEYPCEACGKRTVYGAQEAPLRGRVEFVDEREEL